MSDTNPPNHLSHLASIRKRPAMFIGGTDFFGFINYLVSAFDLMLECGATFLEVQVGEQFTLRSNTLVPVTVNDDGDILPYEVFESFESWRAFSPDAAVIAALSRTFRVTSSDGETQSSLSFADGQRLTFEQVAAPKPAPSIEIHFVPDRNFFTVTENSPHAVRSYCRRMSFLYPGVTIRLVTQTDSTEYHSNNGLLDYFDVMTAPYQILHKPIHIVESEDSLDLEAVFVFHSWSEKRIWSFANRGRVPDGGTHEVGLLKSIADINSHAPRECDAGILALMAIQYPHVTYEGCIKSRIGNPELIEMVASLVSRGLSKWFAENREEVGFISTIEKFQFAGEW